MIGSIFEGHYQVAAEPGYVLPTITGRAFVTAQGTCIVEDGDPFAWGIWRVSACGPSSSAAAWWGPPAPTRWRRYGARVTLIEAASLGAAATAAGMGHLVVMDDSPAQLALTGRSLELWEALAPDLPPSAQYRRAARLGGERRGGTGGRAAQAGAVSVGGPRGRVPGRRRVVARWNRPCARNSAGACGCRGTAWCMRRSPRSFWPSAPGPSIRSGQVTAIEEGGVRLAGGERLSADLVVVAAGNRGLRPAAGTAAAPAQGPPADHRARPAEGAAINSSNSAT